MDTSVLKHFSFSIKQVVMDEIALEGLEGTGFNLLWRRLQHRLGSQITYKMKEIIWNIVLNSDDISLYQLPEPLPHVEVQDRFEYIDEDSGNLKDPADYLDGPYEHCPVTGAWGSSKYFHVRKLIPSEQLIGISIEKLLNEYGDTIIMVATMEERWQALGGHMPISCLSQMSAIQFNILELIGRSRENGQMTTGMTNMVKIVKEPKNMFYCRLVLKDLNLIKTLYITQVASNNRGIKSIFVRLNRFHQPGALTIPKRGRIHDIVNYLRKQPSYKESTDVVEKNGLLTKPQLKRLKKCTNMFEFEDKTVLEESRKTKKNSKPLSLYRKRRYIYLAPKSDESSQSDEETKDTATPLECQHKVCVSLLRQAYERFLDAGHKGLTQIDLAQIIGVQFYTARAICRIFKSSKIIREFFEDRGKQRVTRYIAVAVGYADAKFAKEKETFLNYISQQPIIIEDVEMPSTSKEPYKTIDTPDEVTTDITEVKLLDGVDRKELKPFKNAESLTLRQLRYANGLLKIIREKKCVTGYVTLSNLIGNEINEPPMATKGFKHFIQRFVHAGQLKIYKLRCPGSANEHNYINAICSADIKPTDPPVRAKYKEFSLRALQKKEATIKKDYPDKNYVQLTTLVKPRYMKVQRLHELIFKLVYVEPLPDCHLVHKGCLSVAELIPEMTIRAAISTMSLPGLAEISHLRIEDKQLNIKLCDASPDISHYIIKSSSLRNGIRMCLIALAMNGLIQLIYQPNMHSVDYSNNFLSKFLFYINRNAKIINTTGEWPRPNTDLKRLEKSYYFETFNDVEQYWNDVFEISMTTRILVKNRMRKKINPPSRREEDIKDYDNGDRYGDGNGPCGFDSCFYMEMQRLWHTFSFRKIKKEVYPIKKKMHQIKLPKLSKDKKRVKPKKGKPDKIPASIKIKPPAVRKKVKGSQAVTWSKKEDYIIMLCMTAITIASPSVQPGTLRVRNKVAKDILSQFDPKKTPSICHRRAAVVQVDRELMHEKDCLLSEMRRRKHLIQKYEGLIRKLRIKYSTNVTKFINESRIPILELVWLIWQVSLTESYNNRQPTVALDLETINTTYNITPSSANNMYNLYKAPELVFLRESVFLSIILTHNNEIKMDTATKIFSIFKLYPENDLRVVVDQLRKSGAISAKEKLFNNQMLRLHLEDIVQSAYKISAKYQMKWLGSLYLDFLDVLGKIIDEGFPIDNVKGTSHLNCVLWELQGCDYIQIITAKKPNIVDTSAASKSHNNSLDIEWNFKLNSGTVACKETNQSLVRNEAGNLDVSGLYKKAEYKPVLDTLSRECVVYSDETLMYDLEDPIISHLHRKKEDGSTFSELQKKSGYEVNQLINRLQELEKENIIKRVGYDNNFLILVKFIDAWALKSDNRYIIITPWLNVEFKIRYNILLEWAGTIINKIFEAPGCSVQYLSDLFEFITTRAVQDACIFLEACGCITLYTLSHQEQSIFSDDDEVPTLTDYNPYAKPTEIVVFPSKNAFTTFAYVRKNMLKDYQNLKK